MANYKYLRGASISDPTRKVNDIPDKPTIGTATDVGTSRAYNNGSATVTYTAAATGGAVTTFTATSTPGGFTATGASPLTVTGLQSATSYTFAVSAANSSGTLTSASTSAITATTVPDAPTMGTPTVATGQSYTGNANVSVAFTPGATGGKTVTGYTVTSSSGNTGTYTVTATNANGTGSASSASASTTPSSVPQAPTIGTATVSGTTASITFTANSTGGAAVSTYTATSSPGGITGTSASSPVSVSGLTAGTAYTFTVTATNANGTSSSSSASNSVTPISYFLAALSDANTSANQNTRNNGVAVDSNGNAYITGYYYNTLGGNNIFISKYNSSGTIQWQRSLTTANGNYAQSIAVDSNGNAYITGGTYSSSSRPCIFVAKYNTNGAIQWQRFLTDGFGAAGSNDVGYGTAVDSSGNVYITGMFKNNNSGYNVVIAKYDTNGTIQWQRSLADTSAGGSQNDSGYAIAVDSSGNVYATGKTNVINAYIVKYNTSGTLQWQRRLVGGNADYGYGITVDSNGNSYVIGRRNNSSTGYTFVFIAKYDTNGTIQWQRSLTDTTGNSSDNGYGITLDSSANAYVTGSYLNASNTLNVVIAKYDTNGTIQWQRSLADSNIQGNQNDSGYSIAVDSFGNPYVVGQFNNTSLGINAFIAKIPTDGSRTGTYTISTGKGFTYAASSLTDAVGTMTDSAGNLTSATSSLTDSAGNLTDAAGALTNVTVTI
jgi:trimeric autotransporter adhesin